MSSEWQGQLQRLMARHAAVLMLLGLLTGAYAGMALSGKVDADGHAALASHLNALLGAFWVLGVAWSVPFLRYGERGARRLAFAVIGAQYANWLITAIKSLWKVAGIDFSSDPKNNVIFAALMLGVVLPSLGAAVAWIDALRGKSEGAR
jgi:(hydroxyamino)benzene mutase